MKGVNKMDAHLYKRKVFCIFGLTLALIVAPLTTSCGQLERRDVSEVAIFSKLIGKKVKTKKIIWAHGISNASPGKLPVDFVSLASEHFYHARYVMTCTEVGVGTVFEIVKVLKTQNWLVEIFGGRRVEYVVSEIGSKQVEGSPLQIYFTDITGSPDDSYYGLNPSAYEVVR